ncbi:GD12908 [Drosophila simulans]|uniref:GD12908 n=1 Tax=Drosophila simulans TaxID=7240 RepID=B4QN88_DROSI|nr:GD12908 [Drosophila simulans]
MWPILVPVLLLFNETSWLNPILASIYKDRHHETVLLLQHSQHFDASGLERFPWPVFSFNEQMDFYVRENYNSEMLVLIWQTGNSDWDLDLWQALDRSLLNMRKVRVLLLRKWEKIPTADVAAAAEHLLFLHVAVIGQGNRIYRLQPYAPQSWLQVDATVSPIFIKVRNYFGRYIVTLPDQFPPRSIVYRNPKTGELQMTGYVYKFLLEFIRIYNFTFRWQRPIVQGERMNLILLRNMTLNGTINLAISLCGFEAPRLVLSTLYAAHLKTLLTKRPTSQQISNFKQLRDSPVTVFFEEAERFYLKNAWDRPIRYIKDQLHFRETVEYNALRSGLNRSNAFSALTSEWLIVAKRQELFKQPIFTVQPELRVIQTSVLLSLVMQSNSIYEDHINDLIHRVQSAGIVEYWKQQTLREMITMGMISQKDPFPYVAFREFKVGDLLWIWILWASFLFMSSVIFLGELLVNCFISKP